MSSPKEIKTWIHIWATEHPESVDEIMEQGKALSARLAIDRDEDHRKTYARRIKAPERQLDDNGRVIQPWKPCSICDTPMQKRKDEGWGRWKTHTTCSQECKGVWISRVKSGTTYSV